MSVRVTRKIKRVLDRLVKDPATAPEISEDTNINFATLWPLLDRMADEKWVTVEGLRYRITPTGQKARDDAEKDARQQRVTQWPGARPRGPRPPYTQRRTPWPRGEGRPR